MTTSWKVWPEYDREIVEDAPIRDGKYVDAQPHWLPPSPNAGDRESFVLCTFELPEDPPEAVQPTRIRIPFKINWDENGESAAFDELLTVGVADIRAHNATETPNEPG